ncbi:hypothetical protein ACFX58_16680 [Sphingomonas sp. NCPPB 2930]
MSSSTRAARHHLIHPMAPNIQTGPPQVHHAVRRGQCGADGRSSVLAAEAPARRGPAHRRLAVDARGGVKRLDWTPRGELATYADCSGQRTFFDYDPLGRLVRSTDALGHERHYRYDAAGRLVALRQPDGGEQHYAWDAEGRLLAYTDPLGATTEYRYRAGGQPVERTDANGERLSYVYDRAGRLVQLVNENGALYRFGYDAADRLTDEIGFDGRHQRYGYNAAGELVHLIEAGGSEHGPGKITRFARDVLGRLLAKRSEGDAACDTRYAYDPLGRLTAADNPAAQIAFAYDPAGQLLRETQTLAGIAAPRTLAHGYDPLGYRSDTTLPDGRSLHGLAYGSGHLHQIDLEAADGTHQTIADIGRDALHQRRFYPPPAVEPRRRRRPRRAHLGRPPWRARHPLRLRHRCAHHRRHRRPGQDPPPAVGRAGQLVSRTHCSGQSHHHRPAWRSLQTADRRRATDGAS